MAVWPYVFGAFLPSLPGWCRHADLLTNQNVTGFSESFASETVLETLRRETVTVKERTKKEGVRTGIYYY